MQFVYEAGPASGAPVVMQRIAADAFAAELYGPRLLDGYDRTASVDRHIPGT